MDFAKLAEVQSEGLQVVDALLRTPYGDRIQATLLKYQRFFGNLVSYFTPFANESKAMLYERLKTYVLENHIQKVIHYDHYNSTPAPVISVLNAIILESLKLLALILREFQTASVRYVGGAKKEWIDSFEPRINAAVNDLEGNLPCAEGYISTMQRLFQELEAGPPEENTRSIVVARHMAPGDFTSDGEFRRAIPRPTLKDFQLVGISIVAFQKSLCAKIDNCKEGPAGREPEVQAAFNAHNYQMFLNAIEFYDNPTYGTGMFKTFADVVATIEMYGLILPDPNEWVPPHCCQKTFREHLQGYEGGKRKRKTRHQKQKRRFRTTKKRALKFSKK